MVIRQYEMKFFLNTKKALTKASVLPTSYTWEITCKILASDINTGNIYQAIDEEITLLKDRFEKSQEHFTPETVAEALFEQLTAKLKENKLVLTYLKINSSPMIAYEIVADFWRENG